MEQKPSYKEGSVKAKMLKIFKRSEWLTYADIREYFDRNGKGVNSIDRFKRFLEADGFIIEMRHRDHNCYEYRLTGWLPPEDKEEPKPVVNHDGNLFCMSRL